MNEVEPNTGECILYSLGDSSKRKEGSVKKWTWVTIE